MIPRTSQPSHAAVNLPRLLRRLQERAPTLEQETWVEVRSGYQSVKYAKDLMKVVREQGGLPQEKLAALQTELDSAEKMFEHAVETHPIPSSSRPVPALPPIPSLSSILPSSPSSFTSDPSLQQTAASIPTLTPAEIYNAQREELLPLLPSRAATVGAGVGGYMGATQLHEELGGQLADMSNRLKLNALHFATSLEEEKKMMESSQLVLEKNLAKTRTSKTKLSSVSKKTRSTTCLVFGAIITVMIAWVWTYMLIRFT